MNTRSFAGLLAVASLLTPCPLAARSGASGQADGRISGHEYVDLGLSVKWAACNIGTRQPDQCGLYFAWGETTQKTSYPPYPSKTYTKPMGGICGDTEYDAARANWGGSWRLPTKAEVEELSSHCTFVWTKRGGTCGVELKSKINGHTIFLPATGYRAGDLTEDYGSIGYIWTGTPNESDADYSCCLLFHATNAYWYWHNRYYGHTIRPVSE